MRAYDLPNYDNWLNSNNPYDDLYNEEKEREWLLKEIEEFEGDEEAIEHWLRWEGYEDPREKGQRNLLGG